MLKKWVMLILVLGVVSARATVPTGPSVMVLPGAGKPFDQFQLDDVVCRQYAQQQIGVAPGQERGGSGEPGGPSEYGAFVPVGPDGIPMAMHFGGGRAMRARASFAYDPTVPG